MIVQTPFLDLTLETGYEIGLPPQQPAWVVIPHIFFRQPVSSDNERADW
jgi:hypothetical protein